MRYTLFLEIERDALRTLLRHKLRSFLTLLGVVFGIAAVITMLGIGEGAQRTVLKEISRLGLQNIMVQSIRPNLISERNSKKRSRLNYGITHKDVTQLQHNLPEIKVTYTSHIDPRPAYQGHYFEGKAIGTFPDYFEIMNGRTMKGRWLTPMDEWNRHLVAVLNLQAAARLNKKGEILGETIKIGQNYFKIVGVVNIPAHQNESYIYIPYETAQAVYGEVFFKMESGQFNYSKVEVEQLVVHIAPEQSIKEIAKIIKSTFQRNHINEDYIITVPLHILESKQRTQHVLNLVLITIAAISLLVGGIGIMNIMLANVTERIPEIGIRMAIGATQKDIMFQFLAETTTLSLLGGLLGCVVGLLAVPFASHFTGWKGVVTPIAVVVSLLVSTIVGLIFGTAPAIQASKMDPGVALRSE